MSTPKSFPVEIKRGNVSVKVYAVKNKGYTEYRLVWYDAAGGRKMRSFSDYHGAEVEAGKVASSFARGTADTLLLTTTEAVPYRRAIDVLRPLSTPIDTAVINYVDAVKRLGTVRLADAVEFYLKRNPRELIRKTVSEAVQDMLAAKRKDGASAVYVKDLEVRLGKLAEAFQCPIGDVTAADVNTFLRSLTGAGRTRNNYRRAIGSLFKFSEASGYVGRDHLDLGQIALAREEHSPIDIFKPEQLKRLIDAARMNPEELVPGWNRRYATSQGLLPYLLLGAFAGLRTAEIQRQLWSDISLERGFIRVTAAKGNTARKRLVPISDNLKQWLVTCWRDEGTCCDYDRIPEAIARLAERAGVEWKHNALRHSFISYRVALTKSIPQVSLEAGNSVQMVNRNYRELVSEGEAKAWFAIVPAHAENVIPLAQKTA